MNVLKRQNILSFRRTHPDAHGIRVWLREAANTTRMSNILSYFNRSKTYPDTGPGIYVRS
jgi:hypothetical protein